MASFSLSSVILILKWSSSCVINSLISLIKNFRSNYIVNTGGAKAKDILALMKLAQEKVREQTGVDLEPEIRVVGL